MCVACTQALERMRRLLSQRTCARVRRCIAGVSSASACRRVDAGRLQPAGSPLAPDQRADVRLVLVRTTRAPAHVRLAGRLDSSPDRALPTWRPSCHRDGRHACHGPCRRSHRGRAPKPTPLLNSRSACSSPCWSPYPLSQRVPRPRAGLQDTTQAAGSPLGVHGSVARDVSAAARPGRRAGIGRD